MGFAYDCLSQCDVVGCFEVFDNKILCIYDWATFNMFV
nr:MAG TPA_asm: hypothetical protein [Caudoviricetes sp.]